MRLISAIKSHGLLWVVVHFALFMFDRWIEFAVYPKVLRSYGVVEGIGVMMLLSLGICAALLAFYDWVSTIETTSIRSPWLKRFVEALSDALGFETLKKAGSGFYEMISNPSAPRSESGLRAKVHNLMLFAWEPVRRYIVAPLARKAFKPALYLYLTFVHDGMTCLILMRPPHCHKMGPKEWAIFVSSVFLSCIGWGAFVGGALTFTQAYFPSFYNGYNWLVDIFT